MLTNILPCKTRLAANYHKYVFDIAKPKHFLDKTADT